LQIRKILVPLDFSRHSMKALDTAIDLARRFDARIVLLHAYATTAYLGLSEEVVVPPDFFEMVHLAAARSLGKAAEQAARAGVPVETRLSELPAAEAIVATAHDLGIDLIVMCTRGLSGLKHLLLGSVAERTLRLARCPVLALKPDGE
jgi:nucleotide-binding universal stress UspA family protein